MQIGFMGKSDASWAEFASQVLHQGPRLCQNKINRKYKGFNAPQNADALVVAWSGAAQTRRQVVKAIHGFAFLQYTPNAVYIDVICAAGAAKRILEVVYDKARKLGKQFVTLSAMPGVINFYRRQGFIHTAESCNERSDISAAAIRNGLSDIKFSNDNSALKHRKFKQFLDRLAVGKLVADKECVGAVGCSEMGYSMSKCLYSDAVSKSSPNDKKRKRNATAVRNRRIVKNRPTVNTRQRMSGNSTYKLRRVRPSYI